MNFFEIAALDPYVKIFINGAIILGPLSIATLIIFLKNIEKESPNRIRWK